MKISYLTPHCTLIAIALLCITLTSCTTAGTDAYQKALKLEKEGASKEEVISAYNKALEYAEMKSTVLAARGRAFFDYGEYDRALSDLTRASELNRSKAYTKYLLGLTYGRLGDYRKALGSFQEAIKQQSKNKQFYYGESLAYMALNENSEALDSINNAIGDNGKSVKWHYLKGVILSRMEKKEAAITQFSKTEYKTIVGPGNESRQVFFDGEREYARYAGQKKLQLDSFWHYGGLWLPEQVKKEYNN